MTTRGPICEEIRNKFAGRLPSTVQDLTDKLASIKLKHSSLLGANTAQNQQTLGQGQSYLHPTTTTTSHNGLYQHPVSSISQQNLSSTGIYGNLQGSLSQANLHSPQPSYTYPPPITQTVQGSHPTFTPSPLPTPGLEHGQNGLQGLSISSTAPLNAAPQQMSSNANYGLTASPDSNPSLVAQNMTNLVPNSPPMQYTLPPVQYASPPAQYASPHMQHASLATTTGPPPGSSTGITSTSLYNSMPTLDPSAPGGTAAQINNLSGMDLSTTAFAMGQSCNMATAPVAPLTPSMGHGYQNGQSAQQGLSDHTNQDQYLSQQSQMYSQAVLPQQHTGSPPISPPVQPFQSQSPHQPVQDSMNMGSYGQGIGSLQNAINTPHSEQVTYNISTNQPMQPANGYNPALPVHQQPLGDYAQSVVQSGLVYNTGAATLGHQNDAGPHQLPGQIHSAQPSDQNIYQQPPGVPGFFDTQSQSTQHTFGAGMSMNQDSNMHSYQMQQHSSHAALNNVLGLDAAGQPRRGKPVPSCDQVQRGDPAAHSVLVDYLKRFLYMPQSAAGSFGDVQAGLIQFQRHMGIPETGHYDEVTSKWTAASRCDPNSGQVAGSGFGLNAQKAVEIPDTTVRYALLGHKWPIVKDRITYRFEKFSETTPAAEIRRTVQLAFTTWSAVTPFNFIEVSATAAADIDVGFHKRDHGDGNPFDGPGTPEFNIFGHAFSRGSGLGLRASIHFDDEEKFPAKANLVKGEDKLLQTAIHEIGHALGLSHCGRGEGVKRRMMFPLADVTLFTLSAGDIEGVVSMYGPYKTGFISNGSGIGGYDLRSDVDSAFAFDFTHTGKLNHLVLYRPGTGTLFILQHSPFNTFKPVLTSTTGLGSFDLRAPLDRGFAFDFDHSGKLDHIAFFRPGNGIMIIVRNLNGAFSPVFSSGTGIGGFDLRSPNDRVFAYDFEHSGRQDYIVCYRAGQGIISIVRHVSRGVFQPAFTSSGGIAGFDLRDPLDHVIPVDMERNGNFNHLLAYRPGQGIFWPISHSSTNLQQFVQILPRNFTVGRGIAPFNGVTGFDLRDFRDRIVSIQGGRLVCFRPGTGVICTVNASVQIFGKIAQQFAVEFFSSAGLPGCDLRDSRDGFVPFDYIGRGRPTDLMWIRRATGFCRIWLNMFPTV